MQVLCPHLETQMRVHIVCAHTHVKIHIREKMVINLCVNVRRFAHLIVRARTCGWVGASVCTRESLCLSLSLSLSVSLSWCLALAFPRSRTRSRSCSRALSLSSACCYLRCINSSVRERVGAYRSRV